MVGISSMEDHAIYDSARLCSRLLEQSFANAENNSEKRLIIEELKGHFHLWAKYVGVFAAPRASLDSRLAPFPDIKDMVIELLDMVERNIQWELNIVPDAQEQIGLATDDEANETDLPAIARPGLEAAGTAINKLIILGASIRRSGRQGHRSSHSIHSGGLEQSLRCLLVSRRFPHARQSICDQIGTSIHIRGLSMQYLKRHNEKLAYERMDSLDPDTSVQGGANDEKSEKPDATSIISHDRGNREQHASTAVDTVPSHVVPNKISRSKKPSGSIVSRGSTVQENQDISFYYPPTPRPSSGQKYISCSICSEPLESSKLTENFWKAHVDRDIEPYICLSEECREPPRFFKTRSDWTEHMHARHTINWAQKIHTERWYCDIDHGEPLEFDHKEPFLTHLKDEHGENLSKSQLQGRARRNRRIATRDPFVCPLCDCVPANLLPHIKERPYKQLSDHIAEHVKLLGFLSLPYVQDSLDNTWSIKGGSDESSTSADARKTQSSPQHHLTDPLDDMPIVVVTHDGKRIIDGPKSEFDIQDDDDPPRLSEPENWLFLQPKDLPTDFELLSKRLTNRPPPVQDEQTKDGNNEMHPQAFNTEVADKTSRLAHPFIQVDPNVSAKKRSLPDDDEERVEVVDGLQLNRLTLETGDTGEVPPFLCQSHQEICRKFDELQETERVRISNGIMAQDPSHRWALEDSPEVEARNRYVNVQAWANSRIHLRVPDGKCDFINASPIVLRDSLFQEERRYIASQGPRLEEITHFWQMVFHETKDVGVVVMLTETFESGREKCSQYFPLSSQDPTMILREDESGMFANDTFEKSMDDGVLGQVTLLETVVDVQSLSEVRKLELTFGSDSKVVWHFLFPGWRDYSTPEGEARDALLHLIPLSRSKCSPDNPLIVHCTSGVGRTGVFVALDYLLQELESGQLFRVTGDVDPVYETVNQMREQRMMMVYNEKQLHYIYEMLREKVDLKLGRIPKFNERWSDEGSTKMAKMSDDFLDLSMIAEPHGQIPIPPKVENGQTVMDFVAQALQSQGNFSGWRQEVPLRDRAVKVYQMITSLRLIKPQIDIGGAAHAALTFEHGAFSRAREKVDYDKECNDKLVHIRDTRARQAAVYPDSVP